jgi:hypothetical protein
MGREGKVEKFSTLVWNLFIPLVGALVFNLIGDALHFGPKAPVSASALDFSIGAAFAIVGVAAAQPSPERQRWMFGLFLVVYIVSQFFDIFLRYRFPDWEYDIVGVSDAVSCAAATVAMWRARES